VKLDGTGTDDGVEDGLDEVEVDELEVDDLDEDVVEVGTIVVVVGAGLPVLVAYVIPLAGQSFDVKLGASIWMNSPSISDPTRLKYHEIWPNALEEQVTVAEKPEPAWSALLISESVYVFEEDGRMPCAARNWYVGTVWKRATTLGKKIAASVPVGSPAGIHAGSRVL